MREVRLVREKGEEVGERDKPEEVLFEHCHGSDNARNAPRRKSVQLHVARDHRRSELRVRCSTRTAASNVLRDIMDLFAVLNIPSSPTQVGIDLRTFSQFLSATMSPSVARVSAPSTTPSLNRHPTIVVPVLVAFGNGTPFCSKYAFLQSH